MKPRVQTKFFRRFMPERKNMKFCRKAELTLYSLFSIMTFHRYYICENCHKIHKRKADDLAICGGWYEPHVFVSMDCANATVSRAWKLLSQTLRDGDKNIN